MKREFKKFIVIKIDSQDKQTFNFKAGTVLDQLKKANIDISNVLIMPSDVDISALDLPIRVENDRQE